MKKLIAMLVCCGMTASMLIGCGNTAGTAKETEAKQTEATENAEAESTLQEVAETSEKTYDEKISFSMTNFCSINKTLEESMYVDDPYYQYIMDKFNVEVDWWVCDSSAVKEKNRLWINGNTMPDALCWTDFNVTEYYAFVNQGLLKPLPEDWETRWPNLARMVELTNLKDLIEVDGRVYIIPHAVYGNFVNLKQGMSHTNLFIRKDLLDDIGMEELGAEVVGKASLSQLREYLEKVAAAGLVENPTLGAYSTNVNRMFRLAYGINNNDFFEDEDGKMVWGPTVDGYVEMIQEIQDWYHSGLIDVDYYLNENSFYKSAFPAGTYAAAYMDGGAGNIQNYAKDFAETHSDYELGKYDFIQSLCITDEEGTPYARGNYNYWYAHVFSPNTDDATMERILDMMDYFSIKNVQIEHALGFEGENWEYDADGNVVPLVDDESLFPDDAGMFNTWGFCNDDFALSGYEASYDVEAVEICRTGYEVKSSGKVLMPSDRYESLSSAAKENYSVDIDAKITEIVVSGEDVETAWNDFIETNRNLWEPVLNELNAQ